ncbi:MAG: tryptophanase [Thermoleophilia bacterium]|nr:tryptophanase [Thermoleophilia bacterium]
MREPEPFRIKMIEPIRRTTRDERAALIAAAGYNLFDVRADDVMVDLLTDSGTGAMSHTQWGSLMQGDESYAGSRSFHRFRETIEDIFGFEYVVPTHQGRAAEHLYFGMIVSTGKTVLANAHFDTTRAHVEITGAEAIDLPCIESAELQTPAPFKGNIDLARLETLLGDSDTNVACVVMTLTNNTGGGQPVSMANLRAASKLARAASVPMVLDIARFAENAYFVQQREEGYANIAVSAIVREMSDLADVMLMSAKKDGLVNIGGFIAMRDNETHARIIERSIVFEGFPTYGGLAGRDIEALATGLREVLDESYLRYRVNQVAHLAECIQEAGVPIVTPPGGHAVYLDAGAFLPHLTADQFPAQALGVALYVEGGVRGVEIGSNMAGRDPQTGVNRHPSHELLRLAVPRRTYTHTQLETVAEALERIARRSQSVPGLKMTYEAPVLRHFTARFETLPINDGKRTLFAGLQNHAGGTAVSPLAGS